jgi:nucleotide-binding universal stress UspA family protein
VLREAQLLADAFDADSDAVYVGRRGLGAGQLAARAGVPIRVLHGDAGSAVLREVAAEDVVLFVVGAHRLVGGGYPIGHVTRRMIQRTDKLVVVVPPEFHPTKLAHVLVPLDGTHETGCAVAGVVDVFASHGAELVVLHAFTLDTIPSMLDHAGALEFWEDEFLRRVCPELLDARVQVCVGAPGAKIVDAARVEPTDLIVLAWRRKLTGAHGRVVADALAHAGVPVLLVPMGVEHSGLARVLPVPTFAHSDR